MSNPPIVMAMGKGWKQQVWRTYRPALDKSAHKAEQEVVKQAITFDMPKLGTVERGQLKEEIAVEAMSYSGSLFRMCIPKEERHTPTKRDIGVWSCVILHEVMHCARFERESSRTILELAASEGLAHMSAELYRQKLIGKSALNQTFLADELVLDPALAEELQEVAALDVRAPEAQEWLMKRPYGELGMRIVDYVGSQHVHAQLERGRTISDLMNQSAGDVLGL
ncbi:MAG TPA: hypothetical protein VFL85_03325 [Candidatus Saccharimonadales bacterium]|nr:hypothetical protein [Candidatus Saccharimonadales bacterium]